MFGIHCQSTSVLEMAWVHGCFRNGGQEFDGFGMYEQVLVATMARYDTSGVAIITLLLLYCFLI